MSLSFLAEYWHREDFSKWAKTVPESTLTDEHAFVTVSMTGSPESESMATWTLCPKTNTLYPKTNLSKMELGG